MKRIQSVCVGICLLLGVPLCSPVFSAPRPGTWPVLKHYDQQHLAQIALPLGGIGTGTVSLCGRGDLRDWEIVNRPAKGFNPGSPFFAVCIKRRTEPSLVRALQGPVELFQYNGGFGVKDATNPGLPCFRTCSFDACYPFGRVNLSDSTLPVTVNIEAFNPLVPGDANASGIPIAVLRYAVSNVTRDTLTVTVCGTLDNFIGNDGTKTLAVKNRNEFRSENGVCGIFMGSSGVEKTAEQWGTIALSTPASRNISYRTSWLPSNWGTALLDFWDDLSDDGMISNRVSEENTPKGSLAVRSVIPPHATVDFTFYLTWHFPNRFGWSSQRVGNYYTTRYKDAWDVIARTFPEVGRLELETLDFVNAFCGSDLPDVVKESALFNLSTLRSQTCFRTEDGRFFAWEGCGDKEGCCSGSCTHVWNYEQAVAYLFGSLARSMREVEFATQTDDIGLMSFRASLSPGERSWGKAAADGQMGCIMKVYRDWQLSGDDRFLRSLYPNARKALQFCWLAGGWDANMDGVMEGCQHNTMDVEYFGPNPQMGIWYLGALRAGEQMALYMKDTAFAKTCRSLFVHGSMWIDSVLFNGRYYIHKVIPPKDQANILPGLIVGAGTKDFANPDYQLANGCLVDQLVGQYMAHVCGLGYLVDPRNVRTTLQSIMKYNFRQSLADHFNCMRTFALGDEAALVMASYPDGRPANPFPYFSEVMTGFEYTAAVGMLYEHQIDDGLRCITSIRQRYDGLKRNPYDEAECGHHYGRAMISWAEVLALTGFHYSAPDKTLQFDAGDGNAFWSNGYSYGTFIQKAGSGKRELTIAPLRGELSFRKVVLRGFGSKTFERQQTVRAGDSLSVEIAANDPSAGVSAYDLHASNDAILLKPPFINTGSRVFQKTIYFLDPRLVQIEAETPDATVHYTLDGSEPTVESPTYTGPFTLSSSATVRARAMKGDRQSILSPAVQFEYIAGIKNVELVRNPSPQYTGHGPLTLVDGKRGSVHYTDGEWLGFQGDDLDVVIDLGISRHIRKLGVGFLTDQRAWVFLPVEVEYSAGETRDKMRTVFKKHYAVEHTEGARVETTSAILNNVNARYIRVRAQNTGRCPSWHPGAGGNAWLFVDEITVN
jgi:non-lysosomal glucosylceramidase